jgi:hypothetical protein
MHVRDLAVRGAKRFVLTMLKQEHRTTLLLRVVSQKFRILNQKKPTTITLLAQRIEKRYIITPFKILFTHHMCIKRLATNKIEKIGSKF